VKGARPGDTLAIEVLELRPRNWGWTAELVDAPNWVVGCFLPDTIFS
jgi:acetamidase/formamidase